MHRTTIATLTVTAALAASARSEVIYSNYVNTVNYQYTINHMPDFDQRRAESADGSIAGLPNDGSMYCVPTSTMNVCAYIATHGYGSTPPGDEPWSHPSSYDIATGSDFFLGLIMGTSATGGTGGYGHWHGTRTWVDEDIFVVDAFFADDEDWPRRWDLAQVACNGGLVAFCWGWYSVVDEWGGIPVVDRGGGHCVTMTRAYGGATDARVWVRDPADDFAMTTQSTFMNRMYWAETRSVYNDGKLWSVDNLVTSPGGDISRILDGYVSVTPKTGITFLEPEQEFSWQLAGSLQGSLAPLWGVWPAPDPVEDVEEIVIGMHSTAIYTIVDIGEGAYLLHCFPLQGGDPTSLDMTFESVESMTISPSGRLYVAEDDQLHMIDGNAMQYLWSLQMPGRAYAMAFDDDADRVVTYDPDAFSIITYPAGGDGESFWYPVPEQIAIANEMHAMATDPTRNGVWMIAGGEPVAYFIPFDGTNPFEVFLDAATEVTDLQVDSQGHLFVANAGELQEYMPVDGQWQFRADGPLSGMQVGQKVRISRSRTNYDPIHHVDGWHNVPPEDDFGVPVPDCVGDVNGDDVVDFSDLVELLSTFGPCPANADCSADLDEDDEVGFSDLLIVLANWGNCVEGG